MQPRGPAPVFTSARMQPQAGQQAGSLRGVPLGQQPVFAPQQRVQSAQAPQMVQPQSLLLQRPQALPARGPGPGPGQVPYGSLGGRPAMQQPMARNATAPLPQRVQPQGTRPSLARMQPPAAAAPQLQPSEEASRGGKRATIYHPEPDGQLDNLKDIRRLSGLKDVPVTEALEAMKSKAADGMLSREQFNDAYEELLRDHVSQPVPANVQAAVYNLFDKDENGVIDMMELICGVSILCAGTEDEKIQAVFNIFDEDGDGFVSMDEMFKFLASIFKVVLTPQVMDTMHTMGVLIETPDDLASVTVQECFKKVDLNHDGKLTIAEFREWFYGHGDDHSMLNPLTDLLS